MPQELSTALLRTPQTVQPTDVLMAFAPGAPNTPLRVPLAVALSGVAPRSISNGGAKAEATDEGDMLLNPKLGQKVSFFGYYRTTDETIGGVRAWTLKSEPTGLFANFRAADFYFEEEATSLKARLANIEARSDLWGAVSIVPVAGAVALDASACGKLHVCGDAGANYTVTLPRATDCAGKVIEFVIDDDVAGLVTLSSVDLINKVQNRVQHAGESKVLASDGVTWRKVAGHSIPMVAEARPAPQINVPSATVVNIPLTNIIEQSVSGMIVNNRITVPRAGHYQATALSSYFSGASAPGYDAYCMIGQNDTSGVNGKLTVVPTSLGGAGTYAHPALAASFILNTSEFLVLIAYQNTGQTMQTRADVAAVTPYLRVVEIPSW